MDGLLITVVVIGGGLFYFLPALIASQRRVKPATTIFLINLAFGWTVLGWLAALIWAVAERPLPAAPAKPSAMAEPFYK